MYFTGSGSESTSQKDLSMMSERAAKTPAARAAAWKTDDTCRFKYAHEQPL